MLDASRAGARRDDPGHGTPERGGRPVGASLRDAIAPVNADPQAGPRPRQSLTRRIVVFNLVGLGLLVAGVLALNSYRDQLIDLRTEALENEGLLIAATLAGSAAREDGVIGVDPIATQAVLDGLVNPRRVRAQVFDRGGRLMKDTSLRPGPGGVVEVEKLPSGRFEEQGWFFSMLQDGWRSVRSATRIGDDPPAEENVLGGVAREQEVFAALGGAIARGERINDRGELIVSVSVPIMQLRKVHGVLVLSTRGGDIDAIVLSERISVLQVFLVALAVSIGLSIILANAIGRPIQRLAEAALAAERGDRTVQGRGKSERVDLPDMSHRNDEIGYLSGALKRMTQALYSRIEATETFAADVAHEIKNPLSSMRSAVETLRFAKRDEDRARLMQVIEHDVARLDRLVTDISNASRLDAELVREEREHFDLNALLKQLAEFNQPKAKERGARIRHRLGVGPRPMRGIEGRLAQVFVNLIDNAVSFSPPGGEIRVAAAGPDHDGRIFITVEDDGPGIPDENLTSVFERFYSQRPESEAFGDHSGLGLSISRQIVEAHGGSIRAENVGPEGDPRRGARFIVELPQ